MSQKKSTISDLEKKSSARYRNFCTVVYPESAPENWLSILSDQCISAFVSPLHDSDMDPTGEKKKPHFHVLVSFEGKKSIPQVESLFSLIGGVGCIIVHSLRAMSRYLCHLDNPDKHQYNIEDVQCFGGADYFSAINLPTDKYIIIREMMDFCRLNNIYSYSDLLESAAENHFQWFRVLCDSGTVVMKEYLKSLLWKQSHTISYYESSS